ncbi:MAG TPA: CbiX/SirB N-terminal domain-containing protein [Trinickia sp.]|jgi:sirohydrochlorin cobaltochelatase|uniref:sirohydrochlorin chelatase n=1 Tax=Trinickia sp. TaxID=2571163 RepID=UPI002B51BB67|nr:CbiX/SirB N-terminal domain-containing protein [Trinickia sp.]HTI18691.1 CbiX/SirB N-terminal domain-containing protein [Trinickia sp.]
MSARHGIVLFGHGARDPRWAEPFERLAHKLRGQCGPDTTVGLAFLELMSPDLPSAVAEQAAAGCTTVTVVPVFVGVGGHIRRDLPAVIDQCRIAHPGVDIQCAAPVGEDDTVLDALAAYCLRQIGAVGDGR